jgi:hypothetical protein
MNCGKWSVLNNRLVVEIHQYHVNTDNRYKGTLLGIRLTELKLHPTPADVYVHPYIHPYLMQAKAALDE